MIPKRIRGTTRVLGQPKDWDESKDGKCAGLAVRIEPRGDGVQCVSAWEPTPTELQILNAGGHVILTVVGGQPPVNLSVEALSIETDAVEGKQP